jgi:hypothetical protein
MALGNTLAYYDTATITAVKFFIVLAQGSLAEDIKNIGQIS